jgi:hypothetical protein
MALGFRKEGSEFLIEFSFAENSIFYIILAHLIFCITIAGNFSHHPIG